MPYSKFNNHLEFSLEEWVISLIHIKTGITGFWGGHVKIVVEGVKKKFTNNNSTLFSTELFIAEYHIKVPSDEREHTWVPQVFHNTKAKYIVLFSERNDYTAKEEQQYSAVQARSIGGINPAEVDKMIRAIKKEQQDISKGTQPANFQYAGRWCCYGEDNADNCVSWAEEKLNVIGLGKQLITDSSKAVPYLHVNSGSILECKII